MDELIDAIREAWLIMDNMHDEACDDWQNKYAHLVFDANESDNCIHCGSDQIPRDTLTAKQS